jgi:hypothetical protein
MPDRVLTSHAGSLPQPEDLVELNRRRGEAIMHRSPPSTSRWLF